MESNLKNMVIVLLVITLVAAAAVAGVFILTKEPIEAAKSQKTAAAIAEVLPAFDNEPGADVVAKEIGGQPVKIYRARKGEQIVGYAIETFANGFGGKISLLVGFTADGAIQKISVLEQKETPGLGDKIEPSKSDFSVQFEGKNPATWKVAVRKDGGDVDAITASTISSRAYAQAVTAAYELFGKIAYEDGVICEQPAASDGASGATTMTQNGGDAASGATMTKDGASGATATVEKEGEQREKGRKNRQRRGRDRDHDDDDD